jgi:hypothetical protein
LDFVGKSLLKIRAGKEAFEHIQKNGLSPSDVGAVVAAAGGPKWFNAYGITRYVIGDFLSKQAGDVHFLGASVGSWQMTAALTSNPTAAIDRLQSAYANYIYEKELDPLEISIACKHFITEMIGSETEHILNHSSRHLHVVTARGKGILSSRKKSLLYAGFGMSFLGNIGSRTSLKYSAERTLFSTSPTTPYNTQVDALPTIQHSLTKDNIVAALQASGTIPFMMDQHYGVPGGKAGAYWDGGMTDYHISLPYNMDGFVLHPHFYPFVYQGWFDKLLPWDRYATKEYMSKVILLSPSDSFVESLPRKRIAEMKDAQFFGFEQDKRVAYWNEISERSLELGESLKELIESGNLMEVVELY